MEEKILTIKNILSLKELSKKPHRVRESKVTEETINYIKALRNHRGKKGKEKIFYLLKLDSISVISATVGRILKRLKIEGKIDTDFYKVRINGKTGNLRKAYMKKKSNRKIDKEYSKIKEYGLR